MEWSEKAQVIAHKYNKTASTEATKNLIHELAKRGKQNSIFKNSARSGFFKLQSKLKRLNFYETHIIKLQDVREHHFLVGAISSFLIEVIIYFTFLDFLFNLMTFMKSLMSTMRFLLQLFLY